MVTAQPREDGGHSSGGSPTGGAGDRSSRKDSLGKGQRARGSLGSRDPHEAQDGCSACVYTRVRACVCGGVGVGDPNLSAWQANSP